MAMEDDRRNGTLATASHRSELARDMREGTQARNTSLVI